MRATTRRSLLPLKRSQNLQRPKSKTKRKKRNRSLKRNQFLSPQLKLHPRIPLVLSSILSSNTNTEAFEVYNNENVSIKCQLLSHEESRYQIQLSFFNLGETNVNSFNSEVFSLFLNTISCFYRLLPQLPSIFSLRFLPALLSLPILETQSHNYFVYVFFSRFWFVVRAWTKQAYQDEDQDSIQTREQWGAHYCSDTNDSLEFLMWVFRVVFCDWFCSIIHISLPSLHCWNISFICFLKSHAFV